jgi:hypothetical protein
MPQGDENLRPNQRAAAHGYPLGFARSQWLLRDRLRARQWLLSAQRQESERRQCAAIHEAVAQAPDWERLLGSFNHAMEDRFPVATIDTVARNVVAWLADQGSEVVSAEGADDVPLPMVDSRLPRVFDNARMMLPLFPDDLKGQGWQ